MSLSNILLPLAFICVIVAPIVVIAMFYSIFRMGRAIEANNPALWNEMKPGFYSDIRVSRAHRRRFNAFVSNREYLTLDIQGLERLVRRYRFVKSLAIALVVTGLLAATVGLTMQ